jgi:hypothetical protein
MLQYYSLITYYCQWGEKMRIPVLYTSGIHMTEYNLLIMLSSFSAPSESYVSLMLRV